MAIPYPDTNIPMGINLDPNSLVVFSYDDDLTTDYWKRTSPTTIPEPKPKPDPKPKPARTNDIQEAVQSLNYIERVRPRVTRDSRIDPLYEDSSIFNHQGRACFMLRRSN